MPVTDYDQVVLKDRAIVEMLSQKNHTQLLLGIRDLTVNRTLNVSMTLPEVETLIEKLQRQVEVLKKNN